TRTTAHRAGVRYGVRLDHELIRVVAGGAVPVPHEVGGHDQRGDVPLAGVQRVVDADTRGQRQRLYARLPIATVPDGGERKLAHTGLARPAVALQDRV